VGVVCWATRARGLVFCGVRQTAGVMHGALEMITPERVRDAGTENENGKRKKISFLRFGPLASRAATRCPVRSSRHTACAEKQASLLGCHTLRVVDPMEFLTTMQRWTIGVLRHGQFGCAAATMRTFAGSTASHAVINLFTVLGLKRPGRRHSRFEPHPDVERSEPLWQREYVAV
jgi:hypothetical protein